jgi:HEAT repeat protein
VTVVTSLLVGCVQPSSDQPWSTRSASVIAPTVSPESEASSTVAAVSSPPEMQPPTETEPPTAVVEAEALPSASPTPVLRGSTPVDRALRIVEIAGMSENALERAYAFEAMQAAPELLLEHGARGVVDENRGVRFVATMAIGRMMLGRLAPVLQAGLIDESDSVRAATIFALQNLGEGVDPTPLAAMVASDDPEIRGNATMVLGMLGNPSAIPLIESSLGRGMRLQNPMRVRITELQAAEALVSLGREDDIEPIRAALFAPVEQGELTVLACDMLGRLGDQQARPMLMRLLLAEGNQRRPPEIRVAAAAAIFRLPAPWEPGLEKVLLEQVGAEDPRLRVQVAAALRGVPGDEVTKALDRLLSDPDPLVRIASAGALLGRRIEDSPATAAVSD